MLFGSRRFLLCSIAPLVLTVSVSGAEPPRTWSEEEITAVAVESIELLPEDQQIAWREYLARSEKLASLSPAPAGPEFSPSQPIANNPGSRYTRGLRLDAPAPWYAEEAVRVTADHVVTWQTRAGAWTKGNDYSISRPVAKDAPEDLWSRGTFDNDATIMELRFLARVIAAAPEGDPRAAAWRACFLRGLTYIFNAQYPNGGFPQIYPLGGGYHDAITYNDNGMGRVLEFLNQVSLGTGELCFVPADLKLEAGLRFARGISCIVSTQIVEPSGRRTGWCQQHDAVTMKPCPARNFEPIAVTTAESTYLVALLMKLPNPSPEVRRAVDTAVRWLQKVQLKDLVWTRQDGVGVVRSVPGAEPLWSRLYEIDTDKPIFGDRDRTIHYAVEEISAERRRGYSWYNDSPASVLKKYPAWQKKHGETL